MTLRWLARAEMENETIGEVKEVDIYAPTMFGIGLSRWDPALTAAIRVTVTAATVRCHGNGDQPEWRVRAALPGQGAALIASRVPPIGLPVAAGRRFVFFSLMFPTYVPFSNFS